MAAEHNKVFLLWTNVYYYQENCDRYHERCDHLIEGCNPKMAGVATSVCYAEIFTSLKIIIACH